MRHTSSIAVPAALALVLTCTVTAAQDKPMPTNAAKPATTLSKAAARDTQKASMQTQTQDAAVKKAKQQDDKSGTGAARPIAPLSERSFDGCHHGTASDA